MRTILLLAAGLVAQRRLAGLAAGIAQQPLDPGFGEAPLGVLDVVVPEPADSGPAGLGDLGEEQPDPAGGRP